MQVTAKCIMAAYDSVNCTSYKPRQGPLPDGLYEIDRNGPLAQLKTNGGKTGKYVFEFDRNAGPDDRPHIYSCKKPGCETLKPFKTLAELGSHTRTAHNQDAVAAEPDAGDDEEEDDLSDRTCTICDPPKVLRTPHGLNLHKLKSHPAVEVAA